MGPVIALYRSRNRFGIAVGRTLTLTAADAADVLLTLNAHATQSGLLLLIQNSAGTDQIVVDSSYRLGLGRVTSLTHRLEVLGNANDTTSGSIRTAQSTQGTAAFAGLQASNGAAGIFGAASPSYTGNGQLTGRVFVHTANGSETGITVSASQATHDIRMNTGGTTERLRIDTTGQVHIGGSLATAIARLQVVGAADELQLGIRANGTQTANLTEWQNSSGTVQALMTGAGALALGTTTSAGRLRVVTAAAGTRGIVVDAAASQTANLLECNDSSANILTKIGPDGRVYLKSPNSAPTDADLVNNSLTWYLNEATPAVLARIRKSDGTYLTLTITNGASPTLA